jgi:hypothetical protein
MVKRKKRRYSLKEQKSSYRRWYKSRIKGESAWSW